MADTHDPMLDGIDQWHATAGTYSLDGTYIPDGTYVRLDDLPALIARVRENERASATVAALTQDVAVKAYATALDDAFDEIQGMRGLRLDGPQMQTEAERRIRMLGGER